MPSAQELWVTLVPLIFLVAWGSWDVLTVETGGFETDDYECGKDVCGTCSREHRQIRSWIKKQKYDKLKDWLDKAADDTHRKDYYMQLLGFRESTPVPDESTCNDMLPLHYCARNGDVTAASMIFHTLSKDFIDDDAKKGADDDFEEEKFDHKDLSKYPQYNGSTLAHLAAKNGQLDFLIWLALKSHGFPSSWGQYDIDGNSPMFYLMGGHAGGNDTYMEWLIESLDADIHANLANQTWTQSLLEWYMKYLTRLSTEVGFRMAESGIGRDKMFNGTTRMPAKNMERLAEYPPIFSLKNMLDPEHADEIVDTARPLMRASSVGGQNPVKRKTIMEFLGKFDGDNDTVLNKSETRTAMLGLLSREVGSFKDKSGGQQLNCSKAAELLMIDRNGDGNISLDGSEDFNVNETNMTLFENNMKAILKILESRVVRTSTVTFIPNWHPVVQKVHDRAATFLGLPRWWLRYAEDLQVVHYKPGQHYGSHMDGMGRMATLFIYLNQPAQGGETAFPWAGAKATLELAKIDRRNHTAVDSHPMANATLSPECKEHYNCCNKGCRVVDGTKCMGRMKVREYRECMAKNTTVITRGTTVKAEKGSAVLWYNYEHAPGEERVEIVDSTHCGCDAKGNEKWASNVWLRQPDASQMAIRLVTRIAIARSIGRQQGHEGLTNLGDDSYDLYIGLNEANSNHTQQAATKTRIDKLKKDFGFAVLGIPVTGQNAALSKKLNQQSPLKLNPEDVLNHLPNADELLWGSLWWDVGFGWDQFPERNLQGFRTNQCR